MLYVRVMLFLHNSVFLVVVVRIDFFDERSRVPSDEEAEVRVTDIAVKILELSKPLLEFGHESCEQVRTHVHTY